MIVFAPLFVAVLFLGVGWWRGKRISFPILCLIYFTIFILTGIYVGISLYSTADPNLVARAIAVTLVMGLLRAAIDILIMAVLSWVASRWQREIE